MTEIQQGKELREFFREHGIVWLPCTKESECDPIEALAEFIAGRETAISQQHEREIAEAVVNELKALLSSVPMTTLSYRQVERRIAELQQQSNGGKNE